MAATFIPKHGTTAGYAAAEVNGRVYDDGELLVETTESGKTRMKQGDGVSPYSKLPVIYDQEVMEGTYDKANEALNSANKAAESLVNVTAQAKLVSADLQNSQAAKLDAEAAREKAEEAAQLCAGYVGDTKIGFVVNEETGAVQLTYDDSEA